MSSSSSLGACVLFYDKSAVPLSLLVASRATYLRLGKGHVKVVARAGVAEPYVQVMQRQGQRVIGSHKVLQFVARLTDAEAARAALRFAPMYGANALEAAHVDYFMELAAANLTAVDKTLDEAVASINEHLAVRTYLVGDGLTIADIAVWTALQRNKRWAGFQKRSDDFVHVLRWNEFLSNTPEFAQASEQLERERKAAELARQAASGKKRVFKDSGGSFDIDLPDAEKGKVVTRFPPEPSGYLHIGHAKAALLNDTIARAYDGKLLLRFDDTNPSKEKVEFVDNIMADLDTLGIKPDAVSHTSDWFDTILKYGTQMIETGKAYIDNTPVELMREQRMEGIESPMRSNSIEENMRLWKEMQKGSPEGLVCVMRAKIDMQSKNKTLRDPVLYRCNVDNPHHRTGTKYKVYPTYDFACPIVDSVEGVTHTLRTVEYRDRDPQFYWMCDALGIRKPHIWDYSRLNLKYTLMSKRKLQWFVDQGLVQGWHDPRFPTVQGLHRRGLTTKALREFVRVLGASKNTNLMDWDKLWVFNKKMIDPVAHRYYAVSNESIVPLQLTDVQGVSTFEHQLHPKDKSLGKRTVYRSPTVYLEQDDAALIKQGEEVTLMAWGNAIIEHIERSTDGKVKALKGRTNPKGSFKSTKMKLHWVPKLEASEAKENDEAAAAECTKLTVVELDHLITVPSIDTGVDFKSVLRKDTWFETECVGEPAMAAIKVGQIIQMTRRGFAICDKIDADGRITLFMIPDGHTSKAMSTIKTKVPVSGSK